MTRWDAVDRDDVGGAGGVVGARDKEGGRLPRALQSLATGGRGKARPQVIIARE